MSCVTQHDHATNLARSRAGRNPPNKRACSSGYIRPSLSSYRTPATRAFRHTNTIPSILLSNLLEECSRLMSRTRHLARTASSGVMGLTRGTSPSSQSHLIHSVSTSQDNGSNTEPACRSDHGIPFSHHPPNKTSNLFEKGALHRDAIAVLRSVSLAPPRRRHPGRPVQASSGPSSPPHTSSTTATPRRTAARRASSLQAVTPRQPVPAHLQQECAR